ncbi:hypothetical protein L2E82_43179 [Cichorium intybus]|uniref:Uncharacterized protein n=1 Tax=Cichorium intybus TaxID=13427 RepID=A0ACB8ZP56_CICIN|nr:hypothetical protein L2E82_43179 [Cichorium intybus]
MDHGYNTSTPYDDNDYFYAELTRQILLLTDEDDEVQVKKKGFGRFNHKYSVGVGWSSMPGNYFSSWSEGVEVEVPGWMEKLWAANGGGTGVFIPRGGVHRSRRRQNKPRKNNDRGKAHPAPGHKNLGSS